jgi:hypothetical protein
MNETVEFSMLGSARFDNGWSIPAPKVCREVNHLSANDNNQAMYLICRGWMERRDLETTGDMPLRTVSGVSRLDGSDRSH